MNKSVASVVIVALGAVCIYLYFRQNKTETKCQCDCGQKAVEKVTEPATTQPAQEETTVFPR